MRCHACGDEVQLSAGERVGMRAECEGCGTDLHVCRNCAHHDESAYNECREPNAERVLDKARANRCDYFRPGEPIPGQTTTATKAALDRLFRK